MPMPMPTLPPFIYGVYYYSFLLSPFLFHFYFFLDGLCRPYSSISILIGMSDVLTLYHLLLSFYLYFYFLL